MVTSSRALMTVEGGEGPPKLAEAAAQLGVPASALNSDFGVVPIDRDKRLYAVEVAAEFLANQSLGRRYRGPFSNPRIEPYSPVKGNGSARRKK